MANKEIKPKKCKICGFEFIPSRPLQRVCGYECALKDTEIKNRKKADKEWRKQKAELKEKSLTQKDYVKLLQTQINIIVRLIDKDCPCISCGKRGKPQSGHYHSTSQNSTLRFHLDNIHIQDYRCNVELSANIIGYNKGLIETYGSEYKDYVENFLPLNYREIHLSIEDLKVVINTAREIIKELKDIDSVYLPNERLVLRRKYNEQLGIYL